MLRPTLSRRTAVLAAVAALAVAAAVGAYFAAQIGDGTTAAQEVEQGRPAVTPTAPAVVKPSVTPLPPSPTAPAPTPTPPAPTPLPTTTATPAPTPQPGVCPPPVRKGPEEAGAPIPLSKMGGPRVEGGTALDIGGATLRLPPGRQFIASIIVNGEAAVSVYDVESGSMLHLRYADGCELARYIYDVALDGVFDQIVAGFEVGTHPAPTPPLTTTATPPPATPEPTPEPGGDGSGAKPPHVEPPPSAMLVTASGEQSAGVYDYCWEGLCVDMLGVIVPADAVIAGAGEPVTFKLAVEPTQLELLAWALDSGKVIKDYEGFFAWRAQGEPSFKYQLPAQSSFQFTPDFPPGRHVIVLGVRASPGDARYGFLLELVP